MNITNLLFTFSGRINRRTYWLAIIPLAVILAGLEMFVRAHWDDAASYRLISRLVSVVAVYMSAAVAAKRWHDRGKSAWWVVLGFVPLIGQVWTLIECGFLPGMPIANRFGPPTTASAATVGMPAPSSAGR